MGPPPPPLFLISLGEVVISGDLGFFQLVFCYFQPGFFFRAGIPLVAPWGGLGGFVDPFWGGLEGSVQLLLLLGSSPALLKEKFQGGIFMPRAGLDFLSDFLHCTVTILGCFGVFFNYFPSPPFPAPPTFIFVF